MNLKHKEVEIEEDNPFANCKLDREKYASILTEILEKQNEGFVLSVNNAWGGGKTTFIRMWKRFLEIKEFETLYFNAWENDFQEEVIIALLSELKELKPKAEDSFQNVLEKTAAFMKKVAPIAAKGVASKLIGDKTFEDIAKATIEFTTEEVDNLVGSFNEKKKGIKDFRKSLESFAKKIDNNKPVIFFIDELDRCKPDYAVRILEMVKHLFSVPGLIFVLAIDKKQLEASIKGFYGNEFDAKEYLKRFIDLEFIIPRPDFFKVINYYAGYFGFKDFYESPFRKNSRELRNEYDNLTSVATVVFSIGNAPLRTIEKTMSHLRVVCSTFSQNQYTLPEVCLLLIDIRNRNLSLYEEISNRIIVPQNLINALEKLYLSVDSFTEKENNVIGWTFGCFLYHYCYDNRHLKSIDDFIIVNDETGQRTTSFEVKIDKSRFDNIFIRRYDHYNLQDVGLNWFIERVSLTTHLSE